MIKVATIIVVYNGEKWLNNCILSVLNSTYTTDIFFVNNASTDSSLSIIQQHKHKEIINLNKNFGFGYANNLAIKKAFLAGYNYFLLINQDVYLEKNTLTNLLNFANKNTQYGIVCPIQMNGKGDEIDILFQNYLNQSILNNYFYESNFVNAAAWLVSRDCIKKIGYFSNLFKHYGEDNNFCHRVVFHNLKIAILKDTKVLHDRNQTQSLEKAIKLAKIKLLTIFLNPNFSTQKSVFEALRGTLGISKYLILKYNSFKSLTIFFILLFTFFKSLTQLSFYKKEKINFNLLFFNIIFFLKCCIFMINI